MLYVLAFFENQKFCFVASLFSIEEIVIFLNFLNLLIFLKFLIFFFGGIVKRQ